MAMSSTVLGVRRIHNSTSNVNIVIFDHSYTVILLLIVIIIIIIIDSSNNNDNNNDTRRS